ncbi:MAG: lytic transglycosylase domain-containing protein, partial [Fimbriimonadaceae bacterium]|nr:lytic transglycosylase domain-containing protein [Fimbriimonadaceae bacterium]
LRTGNIPVRLIVQAQRATETSMITARLKGATAEQTMAAWEEQQAEALRRRQAQEAARRPQTPAPSLQGPVRGTATSRSAARDTRSVQVLNDRLRTRNLSPEVQALIPVYADFIRKQNRRLTAAKARDIAETVLEFSVYYGVDARLIMALIITESNFNPNAVSHAGARGLGQLMPGTARELGVSNSFNTEQNLYGTVKLLRSHLDTYTNRTGDSYRGLMLALAAYNAGPGAVRRHGGVPPFRETQNYVRKVIATYKRLAGLE